MSINLRHVSKELHQKLKVQSVSENVTLESLCVNYLWLGLEVGQKSGGGSSVGRAPTATPLSEVIPQVMRPAKEVEGSNPSPRSKSVGPTIKMPKVLSPAMENFVAQQAGFSSLPEIEPVTRPCMKVGFNEMDGERYRCKLEFGHRSNCAPGEKVDG